MEPEVSLPHLLQPSTFPDTEPVQSSSATLSYFLKIEQNNTDLHKSWFIHFFNRV
jgi:hypothetical protein